MNKTIHFAHGNGFPSPCYGELLDRLEKEQYHCLYIEKVGHSEKFPVTDNWSYLVEEVIHSVKSQCDSPTIAVGHSLGGVLSLLAAIRRPELFQSVIMLDSPLLSRIKSHFLQFVKQLGMADRVTPALRAKGRRHQWKTKDEALLHLRSKPLFVNFTPTSMDYFINHGLQENESGYTLAFDKHVEYQIFRTIPHTLYKYEGKLQVPCAILYSPKSGVVSSSDLRYMKKHYRVTAKTIDGSHMFPMEHPEETARSIIDLIQITRRAD